MSGIGGSEFILLCLIGLLILGPERLPRVARQLGGWVGKARRMTRSLQRQLEEEIDAEKNLGFDPKELGRIDPQQMMTPSDNDTYSPMHVEESAPAPPKADATRADATRADATKENPDKAE